MVLKPMPAREWDFALGGTNIPHNHRAEEEIYLLLRGSGDMVAGLDANGKEVRHAVAEGAAFFFKPGTQVGYYSNTKEGQPHDLMLAVRSRIAGGGKHSGAPSGNRVERTSSVMTIVNLGKRLHMAALVALIAICGAAGQQPPVK